MARYVQVPTGQKRSYATQTGLEEKVTRAHRPDYWLVIITATLLAIGITVVYSISPALTELRGGNHVARQIVAILLSCVAFIVTARIPLETWRRWQWVLLGGALIGTVIALLTPVVPEYPQHRWIRFGPFSLQSVELLKFALLISLAGFLTHKNKAGLLGNFQATIKPLALGLLIVGILVAFIQSDLGSMGVLVSMVLVMIFVAGIPLRYIVVAVFAVGLIGILAVTSTDYRRDRIDTYLHPEKNCLIESGHQACQALIAVGSGGMVGLGLGKSIQAYGYLPEAQNDSIFAIFAEKFGFIGSTILLCLFGALFYRMKRIAERAPDMFSQLIVVGVLSWLSIQAIINIGAMLGLLPLKGITLPLISYGGTSVLFVGAALGLVFQVSRYTTFRAASVDSNRSQIVYENSNDRRRVRGAYHSNSGSRS